MVRIYKVTSGSEPPIFVASAGESLTPEQIKEKAKVNEGQVNQVSDSDFLDLLAKYWPGLKV